MKSELDIDKINSQIDEIERLLKRVDNLLGLAASGGVEDTGCFPNEFPDTLNSRFDEAWHNLSKLISNVKSLKYSLKRFSEEEDNERISKHSKGT